MLINKLGRTKNNQANKPTIELLGNVCKPITVSTDPPYMWLDQRLHFIKCHTCNKRADLRVPRPVPTIHNGYAALA
jgi:hypothetical protein